MPLITKASRRVKKPAWQRGKAPPKKEQRDALAIIANNEKRFSRAFNAVLGELITPETLKLITRLVSESSSADQVMIQLPFFDAGDESTFTIWDGFARKMERTYAAVVDDAIQNENRKRGWKIRRVEKADAPELSVNPDSVEFMRVKSLSRAVDMSNKEQERIREILTRGFASGASPGTMVEEIQDTVGLTEKQTARLARKIQKAQELGMSQKLLRQLQRNESAKIRLQRAKTIARTETNEALAHGLLTSWKQAAEEDLIPPDAKKEWVAMMDTDPRTRKPRTSPICRALNGQIVGIDEEFSTTDAGGFTGNGPPAHPNCRSTVILVFPEGE